MDLRVAEGQGLQEGQNSKGSWENIAHQNAVTAVALESAI